MRLFLLLGIGILTACTATPAPIAPVTNPSPVATASPAILDPLSQDQMANIYRCAIAANHDLASIYQQLLAQLLTSSEEQSRALVSAWQPTLRYLIQTTDCQPDGPASAQPIPSLTPLSSADSS